MTNTSDRSTCDLTELFRPYKTASIIAVTGVSRQTVAEWRNGRSIPAVRLLPQLATFLKIELGALTTIVARSGRHNASVQCDVAS